MVLVTSGDQWFWSRNCHSICCKGAGVAVAVIVALRWLCFAVVVVLVAVLTVVGTTREVAVVDWLLAASTATATSDTGNTIAATRTTTGHATDRALRLPLILTSGTEQCSCYNHNCYSCSQHYHCIPHPTPGGRITVAYGRYGLCFGPRLTLAGRTTATAITATATAATTAQTTNNAHVQHREVQLLLQYN